MHIKVKFYDKELFNEYYKIISIISLIFSFALIAIDIPNNLKTQTGLLLLGFFLFLYIYLWTRANNSDKAIIKINNSIVEVKIGNIFDEQGIKVIAFNEYFDTQVDNKIIANNSLNGIYINNMVNNVNELDFLISEDACLNNKIIECNNNRKSGKKNKYKLGTIFMYNDYFLTAFSKFDCDNRAHLNMNDYINFLINFWNEVDIFYAGRSIAVPLLGSGITRFKDYTISEQELLELLIWSFKISRIKFTYPSQVTIIIHESKKDKINFYKLKIE